MASDVTIDEIKENDIVHLKKMPDAPRIATVISINRQEGTVLLQYNKLVDGKLKQCTSYFKPSDILGFHIRGTPL